MLKVAILTKSSLSLYAWLRLSKGATEVRCSGRHYFTGGRNWKTTRGLVPEFAGLQPRRALGSSSALSGRRERTDRSVIPVRISERELLGLSVRIYVWLLFEPGDERTCPFEVPRRNHRHGRTTRARCRVSRDRGSSMWDARARPTRAGRAIGIVGDWEVNFWMARDPGRIRRVGVFTSASPRCLDGGDVDLPHCHHRLEGTLCLTASSRQRIG
jgi:hypothetical protein